MIITETTRVFKDTKSSTGTLDSASKMITNASKFAQCLGVTSIPMTKITEQFATFSGVVGALNIVERAHEWSSKDLRTKWTAPKYASQSFLTVSHTLEFLSFGQRVGVWNLGAFASPIAPGIVPLEVIKNVCYIPASVCGIWHAFLVMNKQDKKVADLEAKKIIWEGYRAALEDKESALAIVDLKIKAFDKKMLDYISKSSDKNPLSAEETRRVTYLESRRALWEYYKEEIDSNKKENSVKGIKSLQSHCDFKINGYASNIVNEERNSGKIKTKEWLGVVNNIGKFVFGTLALVAALFFTMTTTLVAILSAGWFVTHLFNLAKNLYDRKENQEILTVKPHFVAVPA